MKKLECTCTHMCIHTYSHWHTHCTPFIDAIPIKTKQKLYKPQAWRWKMFCRETLNANLKAQSTIGNVYPKANT